jgi:hypothetical protein
MARSLVLAPSGFGKSTSIGKTEELNIQGLNPEETYVISVTSKPLPFKGSQKTYPITTLEKMKEGRRIITNDADTVAKALNILVESPIKNVVLDDFNYIMQDYYMDNALSKGWDAPKIIGAKMGKIFKAIERYQDVNKNIIVLAHGEAVTNPDGRIYFKLKTTGKMVDEYITPEGKFDITLVGVSRWDTDKKKVVKEYITNESEQYSSPKSPIGMFDTLAIPNDLGLVIEKINHYYN